MKNETREELLDKTGLVNKNNLLLHTFSVSCVEINFNQILNIAKYEINYFNNYFKIENIKLTIYYKDNNNNYKKRVFIDKCIDNIYNDYINNILNSVILENYSCIYINCTVFFFNEKTQ